jgi:hypothetical protein
MPIGLKKIKSKYFLICNILKIIVSDLGFELDSDATEAARSRVLGAVVVIVTLLMHDLRNSDVISNGCPISLVARLNVAVERLACKFAMLETI